MPSLVGSEMCIRDSIYTAATLLFLSAQNFLSGQDGWDHYAGDGFQRYSSLDQIDANNVSQLQILWRKSGIDSQLADAFPGVTLGSYLRSTPIIMDGVIYASNALGLVEAWDAGTGATIWVQQPPAPDEITGQSNRGIEFWSSGSDRRIISTRGEYLYALDADSGSRVQGFGTEG